MDINTVNTEDIVFSCGMVGLFLSMVLYVLFGQITVRKIRKKVAIKNDLGVEFVSGWDIINVAQALALPRFITRKLQKSPIAFFYANTEKLVKHTSQFDRILASLFYWLFTVSIIVLLSLAVI